MIANLQRSCTSKRRYSCPEDAARVAAQNSWKYSEPMIAYACSACGGWHLSRDRNRTGVGRVFRDAPKLPERVVKARARDRRRRR